MWKQRIDTSLGAWRVEDKLGLSVLLEDGVIMVNRYRAVCVSIPSYPNPKNGVIQAKRQYSHAHQGNECAEENPP
jgi:hypothetical protein